MGEIKNCTKLQLEEDTERTDDLGDLKVEG
jgi:hypothetical protein